MKSSIMPDVPDKSLLRPDEIAQIFSVSVRTVYNWHAEGKMEGIKVSHKCLRFPRAVVKELCFILTS